MPVTDDQIVITPMGAPVTKLRTIDDQVSANLYDRLYFTVRTNLVDPKQRDNFLKDAKARAITAELVGHLDGLFIFEGPRLPDHNDTHYRSSPDHGLEARVERSIAGKPHMLPIMNARPARRASEESLCAAATS